MGGNLWNPIGFSVPNSRFTSYVLTSSRALPGSEALGQIATQPIAIIMLLRALIMGTLIEEFGWRGFALDPLQAQ
jgi:membrane protease YdiL (CAAX protease family)